MRGFLLALVMVGCKGPSADTDDTDALVWPAPKPWQVRGESGSVVVTRLDYPENPRVDVYGLFASSTQGYQNAAACAQLDMPCLLTLPDEPDEFRNLNSERFRPRAVDYRWVGDSISVGPIHADFQFDEEAGLAYYRATDEARPELPQALRFGGEWADFDLPAVEFPSAFTVTGPVIDPGDRLDLSGADVGFTWESDGRNEVWLWFQGPNTRRVYLLEDDGEFTLDSRLLNLAPTETVTVGLAAARRKTYDVAGNDLEVLTLAGAGWLGSACGDWLDVPLEGNTLPDGDPPAPAFMGWGFEGIIDGNLHDYYDPDTLEPSSAKLSFRFYDFDFNVLCRVDYDASNAARRTPLITDTNAQLAQTFSIGLFNGKSTCPPVNELIYGTTDLRTYIEQFDWSFAIGEMIELEEPLQAAFGGQWANQSRYMYSVYWSQDGLFGDEQGYGYAFATPSCYRGSGSALETPDFDEPLPAGFYQTYPYWIEPVP